MSSDGLNCPCEYIGTKLTQKYYSGINAEGRKVKQIKIYYTIVVLPVILYKTKY